VFVRFCLGQDYYNPDLAESISRRQFGFTQQDTILRFNIRSE